MRTRRNALALALAAMVVLSVAGCVQPPTHVIPTSEPSSKPVFASNAAALAAAKKAYVGYLAASDAISQDGGKNPQRISPWVTKDRAAIEIKQFAGIAKTGDHIDGSSSFSIFRLQQLTQSPAGHVELSAYVCDVVSNSRIIDRSGSDVTPSTRQDVIPIEVDFQNVKTGARSFLVEGSTPWSGTNFCSE